MSKFTPLTSAIHYLLTSAMDVINMTHSAPLAPSPTMPQRKAPVPTPSASFNSTPPPDTEPTPAAPSSPATSPIHEMKTGKEEVHSLELSGHEYRFCENADSKTITVKKLTFGMRVTSHPVLGQKLLPTNGAKWNDIATYNNQTLEEAIAAFVAGGCQKVSVLPKEAPKAAPLPMAAAITPGTIPVAPVHNIVPLKSSMSRPVIGILAYSGDKQFPDKNHPGCHYTNFAIIVHTDDGEKVLQGEGLKDEIADKQVVIGNRIEVQRLGQIPVEILDKKTKLPKLDASGKPIMGSKWQWKLTVL